MQRVILHIDFDSFFASVEQQDNSLYRNRPIGVTATNGRSCIIAASREAKKMGVKSPSRTSEARLICPGIIFVPAHFVHYWEISKKFIALCENFSPSVEVFSLDEVFMDVTYTARLFGGVDGLISTFKQQLREEVGKYITASVGVSHNKLLAKLASGMKKPDGVMKITPDNLEQVYANVQLTDICGIGRRIEKRLNEMGIYTLLQLRVAPLSSLLAEFGNVEGNFLKNTGLGINFDLVRSYHQKDDVKSVGRQYCLPDNQYDKRKVLQNLYELCEEVAIKLRKHKKMARAVGFMLRGDEVTGGHLTFSHYINTGKDIYDICLLIMQNTSLTCHSGKEERRLQNPDSGQARMTEQNRFPTYTRHISVWVSYLENASHLTEPLFPNEQKQQKIINIIDSINERFGDHTIRNAFLLNADKLTTVPNGFTANRFE